MRNSDSVIIGVIYRHPNEDVNKFLEALSNKVNQLGIKKFYLFGDLNINTDETNSSIARQAYLNTIRIVELIH